jgi:predicted HicB family RNase H-like nuclease
MQKPPSKKTIQAEFIHTAVRLPPDLHATIKDAAERNGRSMNAEIIDRLYATPVNQTLDELVKNGREIKQLVKQILDK